MPSDISDAGLYAINMLGMLKYNFVFSVKEIIFDRMYLKTNEYPSLDCNPYSHGFALLLYLNDYVIVDLWTNDSFLLSWVRYRICVSGAMVNVT